MGRDNALDEMPKVQEMASTSPRIENENSKTEPLVLRRSKRLENKNVACAVLFILTTTFVFKLIIKVQ